MCDYISDVSERRDPVRGGHVGRDAIAKTHTQARFSDPCIGHSYDARVSKGNTQRRATHRANNAQYCIQYMSSDL